MFIFHQYKNPGIDIYKPMRLAQNRLWQIFTLDVVNALKFFCFVCTSVKIALNNKLGPKQNLTKSVLW